MEKTKYYQFYSQITRLKMQHIWIINTNNSTTIFYRKYSDMELDPDLVSGLLTALNNFSEVELKGHGIQSIDMGGLKWVYSHQIEVSLLIIAAGDKDSNSEVMRSRLEIIAKMFIQTFEITNEMMTKGLVKIDRFREFETTLDMLNSQWKQAEKAMGAAAMFDMLGIFQQLFNSFSQIVKYNFFGDKLDIILDEFSRITQELNKMPEIQNNPEFENISFDKSMGWSVITLNPINLDETLLKRVLLKILSLLKAVISKYLSKMALLYSFNKEVYPFLLDQYELLERLGINKTILSIFIS